MEMKPLSNWQAVGIGIATGIIVTSLIVIALKFAFINQMHFSENIREYSLLLAGK